MPAFNRTMTPCQVCESPVWATVSMRAKGKGKFCSPECYRATQVHSLARDFNPKIDRSGGHDACWLWMGLRDKDGYGLTKVGGRTVRAHRLAWEIANDKLTPDGLVIRHLCPGGGNPWCCNPAHLAVGTLKDNHDDKVRAGHQVRGERVNTAKMTEACVAEIRRRHGLGERIRDLADAFGFTEDSVGKAARRQTWKHLP